MRLNNYQYQLLQFSSNLFKQIDVNEWEIIFDLAILNYKRLKFNFRSTEFELNTCGLIRVMGVRISDYKLQAEVPYG